MRPLSPGPLPGLPAPGRPDARARVGRDHFWVAWGSPVGLPPWAAAFVRAADGFMSTLGPRPRIYADDALALLDGIPASR